MGGTTKKGQAMRWSEIYLFTTKEAPADAEITSHQLFIRAGIMKKVAQGIYTYGILGLRSLRKLEAIIREELEAVGCYEVLMPMVQPKSLWEESSRWEPMTELQKFKNKSGQDFCLGATHEEVISDYVRGGLKSYKDLPVSLFQIQTKYRDEIRPRLGLLRGREFLMKDAYTFDVSKEKALDNYEKMKLAYRNIFDRIGLDYAVVEADSGAIGGNHSHEFQLIADSGMDRLFRCEASGYASNEEVTPVLAPGISVASSGKQKEEFPTPNLRTIADLAGHLSLPEEQLVKTFFVKSVGEETEFFALILPGDREVNLVKVAKAVAASEVEPCTDEEVRRVAQGASAGSCGPVGLDIPVIMDQRLSDHKDMVVGANKDDVHLKHVEPGRDFTPEKVVDISTAVEGDPSPCGKGPLVSARGIEVGHIFYLGQKYAEPMGVRFLDNNGKSQVTEMGCYGIGVSRTVQAAVEQSNDKDGIIWPEALAPYRVHICLLDDSDEIADFLQSLEGELKDAKLDYLIDDRKERPGVKFKDADLIGAPVRVVIGRRAFEKGVFEVRRRGEDSNHELPVEGGANQLLSWMTEKG